ncbi:MAG: hypothetical protein KDK36_18320, partial [Leptospiraceae bacterium]|nr:hypothetical protein [Leptospiraceae bacterium]
FSDDNASNEDEKTTLQPMKGIKEKELEILEKDIKVIQDQIDEIIPYFVENRKKDIKDNKLIKENRSGYTWEFGSQEIYVVNESFNIKLNSDKMDTFSIKFRKSRLNENMNSFTILREIEGKTDSESTKIRLKVQKMTPGTLPEEELEDMVIDDFPVKDKLSVYRLYRNNLFSMLKYLELRKEADNTRKSNFVRKTMGF